VSTIQEELQAALAERGEAHRLRSEQRGREARRAVPRASHASWRPPADRRDPVSLLQAQDQSRVAELVPIRYGRMARSPLSFFRGTAAIMAADLAQTQVSGLQAQLCGDAHLSNFGGFASPDREMVFDLNDFDETLPGPFEWDLKRLAASLYIAGRQREFDAATCDSAALASVTSYVDAMRSFSKMGNLEVWYARLEARRVIEVARELGIAAARRRAIQRTITKARRKESRRAANKLTELVDGHQRFVNEPPLIVPARELLAESEFEQLLKMLEELLTVYSESLPADRRVLFDGYRLLSIARKVVGVGSVGTRAWVLLFAGRDETDPLVLQCKEAQASVLEPYARASGYSNHGQRVVEGQRLMQAASDIFLGWLPVAGVDGQLRDYYVRQLWDGKLSVEVETMEPVALSRYASLCGWTLARAHARSGDRVAIASYLGRGRTFSRAIAEFAAAYADQNDRDYAALMAAIDSRRVSAVDA
jgi:uncharacterized protein (DUF2252 family)